MEAAEPAVRAAKAAVEARNRRLAGQFHDLVSNRRDGDAARALVAEQFVDHDPAAGGGPDGIAVLARGWSAQVVRTVADGDHVILHSRIRHPAGELAAADIYRFGDGRIVEHWVVRQPVPEHARNDNTMF